MKLALDDAEFNFLFQETVIELFFLNLYQEVLKNTEFCLDSPVYFYRFNKRTDILILNYPFLINENYYLSASQRDKLLLFISLASENQNFIKCELLRLMPEWLYFISSDFGGSGRKILKPEIIKIPENILSFLSNNSENFFVKEAQLLISYNLQNYALSCKLFQSIIALDPGNPFILLRYARFLGSACYKRSLNIRFIYSAISYMKLAIVNLGPNISDFTFCYAWIGQLYHAISNFNEAIVWYNKTISLNESQGFYKEESYIWYANALTGLGKFKESISVYEIVFKRKIDKKHSIDFRNFKIMAINYWHIREFINFRFFFIKSLKLLMDNEQEIIYVTIGKENYFLSDIQKLLERNSILNNNFSSFKDYYSQYLGDLEINFGMKILYLGWLFLKNESSILSVGFHNSRGFEKLCFYYLQTFLYEKKGIGK